MKKVAAGIIENITQHLVIQKIAILVALTVTEIFVNQAQIMAQIVKQKVTTNDHTIKI